MSNKPAVGPFDAHECYGCGDPKSACTCEPKQHQLTFACPDCKQPVEPGQGLHGLGFCIPKPPGADTEQAFWDACVVARIGGLAGAGMTFAALVRDACDMADVTVAERRKRIAARAKGG